MLSVGPVGLDETLAVQIPRRQLDPRETDAATVAGDGSIDEDGSSRVVNNDRGDLPAHRGSRA